MFLVGIFIYMYQHKIQISLISSKQKSYTRKEKVSLSCTNTKYKSHLYPINKKVIPVKKIFSLSCTKTKYKFHLSTFLHSKNIKSESFTTYSSCISCGDVHCVPYVPNQWPHSLLLHIHSHAHHSSYYMSFLSQLLIVAWLFELFPILGCPLYVKYFFFVLYPPILDKQTHLHHPKYMIAA